nr:MurR/RpiR family transcriptional regulator [Catenibacterium mitsuokai]
MPKGISIMSRLLSIVNYGDGKEVNADIAKTILQNYHKIPELTIFDLADLCYVSSSSITRFVRTFGYDSYKQFKNDIDNTLTIDVDYSKRINMATAEDLKPIYQRYTENVIENIQFTFDHIDYRQLNRVCEMMYQAKEIALFGLEYANYVGIHFQNKMASLNRLIQLGVSDEKQLELAKRLAPHSLVFIISLEGSFFYRNTEIVDILTEKECKIVAISMLTSGKFIGSCDEVILCNKTNSNTEGRITLMYTIELIIIYYYINYSHI